MILLFGLAGSGKSTQGKLLAEERGWKWLSVGEVLRNSGEFQEIMDRGELVDDGKVIEIMAGEIEAAEKEYGEVILDGYPRDLRQAQWLVANEVGRITGAIYLDVPKEELWERIKLRGREDDTEEAVKKRFLVVEQNICSILEVLREKGVPAVKVDGTGTVEEVAERMRGVVGEMVDAPRDVV